MTQLAYAPRAKVSDSREIAGAGLSRDITRGAEENGDGLMAMALMWALFHSDCDDA